MGSEKLFDFVARRGVAEDSGTAHQSARAGPAKSAAPVFDCRPLVPHKIPRQLLAGGISHDAADNRSSVLRAGLGDRIFQRPAQQLRIAKRNQRLLVNRALFRIFCTLQVRQHAVVESGVAIRRGNGKSAGRQFVIYCGRVFERLVRELARQGLYFGVASNPAQGRKKMFRRLCCRSLSPGFFSQPTSLAAGESKSRTHKL